MAEREKDRKYPFLSPDSERTLRQLERLLKPAFDPVPTDLTPSLKKRLRIKCAVKLVEQLIADSDKQALKIADEIIQENPLTAR